MKRIRWGKYFDRISLNWTNISRQTQLIYFHFPRGHNSRCQLSTRKESKCAKALSRVEHRGGVLYFCDERMWKCLSRVSFTTCARDEELRNERYYARRSNIPEICYVSIRASDVQFRCGATRDGACWKAETDARTSGVTQIKVKCRSRGKRKSFTSFADGIL